MIVSAAKLRVESADRVVVVAGAVRATQGQKAMAMVVTVAQVAQVVLAATVAMA